MNQAIIPITNARTKAPPRVLGLMKLSAVAFGVDGGTVMEAVLLPVLVEAGDCVAVAAELVLVSAIAIIFQSATREAVRRGELRSL
jgi:hypothetical protein